MASNLDPDWRSYIELHRSLRRQLEAEGSITQVGHELIVRGPSPTRERGSLSNALILEHLKNARVEPSDKSGDCAICLDSLVNAEKAVTKMPCDHLFHEECVLKWLENHKTCPTCRLKVQV